MWMCEHRGWMQRCMYPEGITMLAFASLFLGLVFGTNTVEVAVDETVARVEIFLDDARIGSLEAPPWSLEADFGDQLAPRRLEAVAFDAAGKERARAVQWLNLPQPRAAISVVLEPKEGGGRWARVTWESAAGAEPKEVEASLDSVPLEVGDPRRIALPAVDEESLHLLQIEMRFDDRVRSRADVTFGGAYVDQVSTEITALPIIATGKSPRAPRLDEVQSWFTKNGERLDVIAVERGAAEIIFVMGRPFPHFLDPFGRGKVPKSLELPKGILARFVSPIPTTSEGVANTFNLFPVSPPYDRSVADLYHMLTGISRSAEPGPPRPAAATAVAGLAAFESRRRRTVVLIPPARPGGEADLSPHHARGYLERLRVPFEVWDPEDDPKIDHGIWGPVRAVDGLDALAKAFEQTVEKLDRQWIVWLDGRHLPQAVELTAAAAGFEIAAR